MILIENCVLYPGTTTSTMTPTPAPDNSAPTGIFSSATESLSSVTSTPGIFSTSVTQRETSSSNSSDNLTSTQLPNALPTSLPGKPNLSTTVSLTESLPGETLLANSSIELTTGNNVSTTGNISSTYHSPPALRTTSAVPISSLKNYTTIQQESTDYKSTLGNNLSFASLDLPHSTAYLGSPTITAIDGNNHSWLSNSSLLRLWSQCSQCVY